MTRRPMTAAEKRDARIYTPLAALTITGCIWLAGLIQGAPA